MLFVHGEKRVCPCGPDVGGAWQLSTRAWEPRY